MEKLTLIESKRRCGFRKPGQSGVGIYLMGEGIFQPCERLPFPLWQCECCGYQYDFFRGIKEVDAPKLFYYKKFPICDYAEGHNHATCVMCSPEFPSRTYLMWVGEKFYPTPSAFISESKKMGVSKRLPSLPNDFDFGNTVVYLAHNLAIVERLRFGEQPETIPGVFMAFWPTGVDLVVDDLNDVPEKAVDLYNKYPDNSRIVKVIKDEGEKMI